MIALLRVVLAALAAYHLAIGVLSVTSFGVTSRAVAALYGASLADSPQQRHLIRLLGLYALALGALLTMAAMSPEQHRPVIAVVAALQLARAVARVAFHRQLAAAFQVPASRNAGAVALLLLEAVVLVTGLLALEPIT